MDYLKHLNPEQLSAVTDTEGAVLVLAGAGSGKTRVLTSRIAYILDKTNVNPSSILAITFTNKAAAEMKDRVIALVGQAAESMWVSTIHSMCVRILRNSIGKIEGYNRNFSIYSEVDKERIIKRIIKELNLEGDSLLKNAKYYISNAKNNDLSPDRFLIEYSGLNDVKLYFKIYSAYEEFLKKSNALDFDDLLLKTYHLLDEDEEVLGYYANKFRYIHIDEFQDTNFIQYNIAKLLSSVHGNIFVVGDDDQSIYGWRGAEIKNILDFNKDFKGAKVYKLQQNYRSTKKILDLANTLIANNRVRSKKELWTENDDGVRVQFQLANEEAEEAEYTAAQIKNLVAMGAKYSDFAVVMRINALSRSYEQEFTKYAIPYKIFGGFKFYERKEIKDLMAYLRLISNPLDNESLLRIINTPKRGIGDKTIDAIKAYANKNGFSIFDAISEVDKIPISSSARSRISSLKQTIFTLILESATLDLKAMVLSTIQSTAFLSQFDVDTEENLSKRMNIDEFVNSVEEFVKYNKNACSLNDFLASVTLISDIDEADNSDYVTVATIHAVKGLEFNTVFIAGLDETIFPITRASSSTAELEEERRLMYVAITRARKRLYITRSRSRYLYGSRQFTMQSRFVTELSEKLGIKTQSTPKSSYGDVYKDKYTELGLSSTGGNEVYANYAKTFATKTESVGKKDFASYKSGKTVIHKKFGKGTIIEVRGSGFSAIAVVAFKGYGIKTFSISLAPMEVVD